MMLDDFARAINALRKKHRRPGIEVLIDGGRIHKVRQVRRAEAGELVPAAGHKVQAILIMGRKLK